MSVNHKKRLDRQKKTAEVFTPDKLVRQMLDKLPKEVWKKGKTFGDPAVGNGNFLIHVLRRKIERGHAPLEALKTLYGVDIMQDNIKECRMRLLKQCTIYGEIIKEDHIKAVFQNIIWVNHKRFTSGALDYNFEFPNKVNLDDVAKWMFWVNEEHKLDDYDLPVTETNFTPEGSSDNIFEQF